MRTRPLIATLAVASLGVLTACGGSGDGGGGDTAAAGGSGYPDQPVTITAPADPGSGWDTTARALVETLQKEELVDVPLPVQNRPGATGAVWMSEMVNNQEGQAYEVAITSLPIMSNQIRGLSEYGYEDVTMIARLFSEYYMVVTPTDSEYQTLDDVVEAIEADPASVPVGAAGDDRLPFALLVQAKGVDPQSVNFINYEGGGEQITALLNGDIDVAIAGVSEFRGQLEAKALRGLAVIRDERLEAPLDDVPTAQEQGYDVTLSNWRGVYGPPEMPAEAVTYWEDTLEQAMQTETWKEFADRNQWETTFMKGSEMQAYLDTTFGEIDEALQSIGEGQ